MIVCKIKDSRDNQSEMTYRVVDETGSAFSLPKGYYSTTQTSTHVCARVRASMCQIADHSLFSRVSAFTECFAVLIDSLSNQLPNNTFPILETEVENDHVLIMWPFRDFRIGFSFDSSEEASYFILTNTRLGEITKSGPINEANMRDVIALTINFAAGNV